MTCPISRTITPAKKVLCALTGVGIFGTGMYGLYYARHKIIDSFPSEESIIWPIGTSIFSVTCVGFVGFASKEYLNYIRSTNNCCKIITTTAIGTPFIATVIGGGVFYGYISYKDIQKRYMSDEYEY